MWFGCCLQAPVACWINRAVQHSALTRRSSHSSEKEPVPSQPPVSAACLGLCLQGSAACSIVSSYVTPAKCFRPATASDRQGPCPASLSAMCLGLCLQGSAACRIVSSYVTPAKCFCPATASDRQGPCQASLSAKWFGCCLQAPVAC